MQPGFSINRLISFDKNLLKEILIDITLNEILNAVSIFKHNSNLLLFWK